MVQTVQILFVLGLTNLLFLILVALSCRCLAMNRLTDHWLNHKSYQKFYSYHCYYWYGFILSVLTHTTIALWLFGWPF